MNEIQQLESLGLTLPSPAYLAGAILFGIWGYVAYRRGRRTAAPALTWPGLALMLYPLRRLANLAFMDAGERAGSVGLCQMELSPRLLTPNPQPSTLNLLI